MDVEVFEGGRTKIDCDSCSGRWIIITLFLDERTCSTVKALRVDWLIGVSSLPFNIRPWVARRVFHIASLNSSPSEGFSENFAKREDIKMPRWNHISSVYSSLVF